MDAEGLVGRTLVGRFRIERVLGRGGMATVYAAFDQQRGIPVALKVLKRELTRDSMVLRRFEREAKAASHLEHPNVVEVLDWGVEGDEAFISMELAQGTDLLKALSKQRPMKQVRAVLVLSQVCAALSAAHAKGIVHRDLKPENILLVPDPMEPGGERAKVLDFGIAKVLDVSKGGGGSGDNPPSYVTKTALTRVGTIVGTPAYMSPEQCRGGEIDGRSDIYACGVLLYQLVTGELPFTGETPLHTAMRHIHAQARPPAELRPDLAPRLERVITKALAKWPGERQQTAEQLRKELLGCLADLPDRGDYVLPDELLAGRASSPPREPTAPAAPPADVQNEERTSSEHEIPTRAEVEGTNPTAQLVGGPLGGTPLRAVRLLRGTDPTAPRAEAQAPASLSPSTTRPDAPLGGSPDAEQAILPPAGLSVAAGAAETTSPSSSIVETTRQAEKSLDDDDDPRTLMRVEAEEPADGLPTPGPIETPRTAGNGRPQQPTSPKAPEVQVKTDPIEQQKAKLERQAAPTLLGAAASPPKKLPARTEQILPNDVVVPPMAALGASPTPQQALLARPKASTDRPLPRAAKAKPTQTGLTPTMAKEPPRREGSEAAPRANIAAHLPPPPPAPSPSPSPGPPAAAAEAQPRYLQQDELRRNGRNPTAPLMAQPSFALSHAQLGRSAVGQAPSGGAGGRPLPPDEDEPPTNVREVGPASKSAKTLVMEETATQGTPNAAAAAQVRREIPNVPVPSSPGAAPAAPNHPGYAPPEESLRGLKATARIPDEERVTNQIGYPPPQGPQPSLIQSSDNLQAVKATVRMNPQEAAMTAAANAQAAASRGVPPSSQPAPSPHAPRPPQQPQPQPQPQSMGTPHGIHTPQLAGAAAAPPHDPAFQTASGYRLAPGSWTEPTVVKRRAQAPQQQGLVSSLQGLSGTTGLLIGIGLGLGIAAGLLIAFLLARG